MSIKERLDSVFCEGYKMNKKQVFNNKKNMLKNVYDVLNKNGFLYEQNNNITIKDLCKNSFKSLENSKLDKEQKKIFIRFIKLIQKKYCKNN